MTDRIDSVLDYVLAENLGGIVGVYLYGSSTTTALVPHQVLHGPPLSDVVAEVSREFLRQSQIVVLPSLLDELQDDERNVLLTLARALVTAETGRIVTKPEAAEAAARRVDAENAELLRSAPDEYLGGIQVDWVCEARRASDLARSLAELVREAAGRE